jgi:lipopolysaccharide/colanic/teichoic acid biosynthesis glycosyltransferase
MKPLLSLVEVWESAVNTRFQYGFCKRMIDVGIAALGLVALAPALGAIGLVSWRRLGRPILFAQERVGRGGRRFRLYKFRTLPLESDPDRRWTASPVDGWGRLLRATGLDELPQLWNVLRGDMSLVGPRPERPHFADQFRRQWAFYATRHTVHAGITGWAQVHGWRGDTSIARRVEYDLYYLEHWSLGLDFRILWMTLADFWRRLRRARDAGDL